MIHSQIQELVSQSLLALQEIEEQKKSYELSIGEIFHIAIKRVRSQLKKEEVVIEEVPLSQPSSITFNPPCPAHPCQYHGKLFAGKGRCIHSTAFGEGSSKVRILISDDAGGIPQAKEIPYFLPSEATRSMARAWTALAMQLAESMEASLELLNSDEKVPLFAFP